MASTAQLDAANSPRNAPLYSRFFSPAAIENCWVKIPGQLRIYSRTLWTVWTDGAYLTAWPRVALLLPWAALLMGFVEGATHWSLLTLGNDKLSLSDPAVIFAQFVPLLFLAVLLGSLSAHLGLMVVSGYALGDYLIAGPFLTNSNGNPISGFLCLRIPQLLCYALFLAVAAAPVIASNGLLSPFARRLAGNRLFSIIVRTAALAGVAMTLVYGWTLVAPLVFRVVWSWAGQGPPISVRYFRDVLNPWLPLTAGLGIVTRSVLIHRTRHDEQLLARTSRVLKQAALADQRAAWSRRLPTWFRAVLTAAWSAFLLAGMMTSWLLAALVCSALLALYLLRNCILPKIAFWAKLTRRITAVPLIFRLALVVAASYFATRGLLQIPGWSISANSVPGQFGILLACAAASLLINLVVIPFAPAGSIAAAEHVELPLTTPAIRVAAQVFLLVLFLFLPLHAFAVCMDPSCCFGGDNGGAGGPMGALGGGMGMGGGGGLGGSGEGGEGGGPEGGADGGGDDPTPSSEGGPSGGGGGGGNGSASGSSAGQGGGGGGSFGSASSPGDSGNSAPSSSSDQGTGNAGPGSASSPDDSGNPAPGSSPAPGSGDSGSPSPGSSPGSEAIGDPSSSSPSSSPDDSQSPDGQQQLNADQNQEAADDFQKQASQDQTAANDFQQQASQDQTAANDFQQQAMQDETAANDFQQQASDDQQAADDLNQLANQADNPSDAASLRQAANEAAEQAAEEQQFANQAQQDASEAQQLANQAAQEAADLQHSANQAAQEAAEAQKLANEASSEAQAQRNAAAPMTAEQPASDGTQGNPTNQPPPPQHEYVGPKKP